MPKIGNNPYSWKITNGVVVLIEALSQKLNQYWNQ